MCYFNPYIIVIEFLFIKDAIYFEAKYVDNILRSHYILKNIHRSYELGQSRSSSSFSCKVSKSSIVPVSISMQSDIMSHACKVLKKFLSFNAFRINTPSFLVFENIDNRINN